MQERRTASRIDKVFRVLVSSEETGDQWYVARNISTTGMFIEMADPFPLKTKVIVRFQVPGQPGAICAIGRVQNQYRMHYTDHQGLRGLSGVGLRLVRFIAEAGASAPTDLMH